MSLETMNLMSVLDSRGNTVQLYQLLETRLMWLRLIEPYLIAADKVAEEYLRYWNDLFGISNN